MSICILRTSQGCYNSAKRAACGLEDLVERVDWMAFIALTKRCQARGCNFTVGDVAIDVFAGEMLAGRI